MKILILLAIIAGIQITNSQSVSIKIKNKNSSEDGVFRPMISAGIGSEIEFNFKKTEATLNLNAELMALLKKNNYIGVGVNHHDIPSNKQNKATYLYFFFSKGYYLARRLAMYPGLGLTVGITSQGHPGCCILAIYGTFNVLYDVMKFLSIGMNTQVFTNFGSFNIIPGLRISIKL